jgi:hypothetical protein
MHQLNLAAILTRIRHFESVKKLFFRELWLNKFLKKIKKHVGFMILAAILKQNKIQLGSELITVAYTLKLNCAKFERDQRYAFLNVSFLQFLMFKLSEESVKKVWLILGPMLEN